MGVTKREFINRAALGHQPGPGEHDPRNDVLTSAKRAEKLKHDKYSTSTSTTPSVRQRDLTSLLSRSRRRAGTVPRRFTSSSQQLRGTGLQADVLAGKLLVSNRQGCGASVGLSLRAAAARRDVRLAAPRKARLDSARPALPSASPHAQTQTFSRCRCRCRPKPSARLTPSLRLLLFAASLRHSHRAACQGVVDCGASWRRAVRRAVGKPTSQSANLTVRRGGHLRASVRHGRRVRSPASARAKRPRAVARADGASGERRARGAAIERERERREREAARVQGSSRNATRRAADAASAASAASAARR